MTVVAKCICKAVTVTAEGDPAVSLFCHCDSCCKANSATFAAIGLFPADKVTIDGPTKEVKVTERLDGAVRISCANCGTRISSKPAKSAPLRSIYPITTEDQSWFKPSMHIYCSDAAPYLNPKLINDGLPKFADTPEAFGGSGKMFE